MSLKIFFGSTSGNTEKVAKMIQAELGGELMDVRDATADDFAEADAMILGLPTYEEGQLQEDWANIFEDLDEVDFSGKTVALFGLGDQENYAEYFVDALGKLGKKVRERGAKVVGSWPTEGYNFEKSLAVEGDHFIGLVIDEDNQAELTEERVKTWCAQIKSHFS